MTKMTYQDKRKLQVGSTAELTDYEDIKIAVYTWMAADSYVAAMYGGKRTKRDWAYSFKTEDARQNYINKQILMKYEIADDKAARKVKAKETADKLFKTIEVGDVFVESGGYEQTNVYYYQLVELKGKTGTFRPIQKETVPGSEGMMSCNVIPAVDEFIGEAFKKRITGDRVKVGYYNAYKVAPGKENYCSWYG
jgi:hypothetical protein